ncbi:MAG: hypothetical protein M1822_001592 [Bathelium mastoideum]|nr:MAG: hypothetical protein M1822_001592 [Bathelium mastoideum]
MSFHASRSRQLAQPIRELDFEVEDEALDLAESEAASEYQPLLEDLPSPHPEAALRSSKLAALHARLSLPERLPLQTLARTLVDSTADSNPAFNNSSLAALGSDILGYYTSERLLCCYPRLPMVVLFAAQSAYVGPRTLAALSQEWGVETAACPGGEVDPGLLQFTQIDPGAPPPNMLKPGFSSRSNDGRSYRRGVSSRIVYDDQFGDMQADPNSGIELTDPAPPPASLIPPASKPSYLTPNHISPDRQPTSSPAIRYAPPPSRMGTTHERARQTFVRALLGALYLHCGKPYTRSFFRSHILSRTLRPSTPSPSSTFSSPSAGGSGTFGNAGPQGLASLFAFTQPTRDLSRLCAREGFVPPVARLVSETGRHSRHPVFVVGVYSGRDKLGEGAGASLDEARNRAAANALRGWYLYSPVEVSVPSDVEGEGKGKRGYVPAVIDPGEVVV